MTNECFMTIRFKDEVVRRHFVNDITEKVIPDQDNIECDENPIYEDVVFFAFPDQPYFDTSMPDNYWNFLTLMRANQVVNQGIPDSKYGVDSRGYSRLLAKQNTPESIPEQEVSRQKGEASSAC